MPWITPERKETRERLTIKIDVAVLQQLEDYAAFVDSSQSYVVTEILRAVFGRDKDFQTWRQTRTGSYDRSYDRAIVDPTTAADAAARITRRRRRVSAATTTDTATASVKAPEQE